MPAIVLITIAAGITTILANGIVILQCIVPVWRRRHGAAIAIQRAFRRRRHFKVVQLHRFHTPHEWQEE
jgi:hypothetical protein